MLLNNEDYGLLQVTGPDSTKFLQGQLTCNVEAVSDATTLLAAHCNSQGRVISLFNLFKRDDSYFLLMPRSMLDIAANALKKYMVFFKSSLQENNTALSDIDAPHYFDVRLGIPCIYPETTGKFLPHELNLPALGAVDFNKGCYTGQEIIARMHYRGKLKKSMHTARVASEMLPLPGATIYKQQANTAEPAGTIIDSRADATAHYLLLLTDDENAKNQTLFLNPDNPVFIAFTN
jgi:folate-binding protein YgfZ